MNSLHGKIPSTLIEKNLLPAPHGDISHCKTLDVGATMPKIIFAKSPITILSPSFVCSIDLSTALMNSDAASLASALKFLAA